MIWLSDKCLCDSSRAGDTSDRSVLFSLSTSDAYLYPLTYLTDNSKIFTRVHPQI